VRLPFYQVDAFTREAFGGNPAAVVRLRRWIDEQSLFAIAAETNLPATAFVTGNGPEYQLRWMTAHGELQLCGHATLASGYVVLNNVEPQRDSVAFATCAGRLEVVRDERRLALDFPALPVQTERRPALVSDALGIAPQSLWEASGERGMAVLADAAHLRELRPHSEAIAKLPFSALIVTAPGFAGDCDFVSRYFAPKHGIAEDFATGSAHCVLGPYWAGVLGKAQLFGRQLSSRGGEFWVEDRGDRVRIGGECVPIAEGTLTLTG